MPDRKRRARRAVPVLAAALALAAPAHATWSIAAVDPETREVGVAGASCILGAEVLARLVPGAAAVAAQAIPNVAVRDEIARRAAAGEDPGALLGDVTGLGHDRVLGFPLAALRQYGVASLGDPEHAANFTGRWTVGWAGGRTGPGVAVQGNMLRGAEVVEQALHAFEQKTPGCRRSLADRLMDALEAGARAGGDRRCSPELAALSAFVVVSDPDDPPGRPSLHLVRSRPGQLPTPWADLWRSFLIGEVKGTADQNPVLLLRQDYEATRSGGARCH